MKIVSFIAATILSVTAFAATTTVYHDYDGALRGIALKNACITEDTVQTIKPARTCVKLVPVVRHDGDMQYTDWICERWEKLHASHSRSFTRTVCAEYATIDDGNLICKRHEHQEDFLPATIKIRVVTSNGEFDDFPGVTKKFTFPACE